MIELPAPPAEIIRKLLYENWDVNRTNSYDPSISDTTNDDFLPLTTDWYAFGDTYPSVVLTNFTDNTVNGGQTGYTGLRGDGLGVNKQTDTSGLLTIQAEDEALYNGVDAQEILRILGNEVKRIISNKFDGQATDRNGNQLYFGQAYPYNTGVYGQRQYSSNIGFHYFRYEEVESPPSQESDRTYLQKQFQVGFGWIDEPHR